MDYDLLLKSIDKEVHSLLDIGCFLGNFSHFMETSFNLDKSKILCVDINESYKDTIESKGYRFIGVGLSSERKNIPVYYPINPSGLNDPRNTGVSYYKETTHHFDKCLVEMQHVVSLDELVNQETFDFVKIDVQGAEYDVIFGGRDVLKKSKYILVETSNGNYNQGCKNEIETIELLNSIGFNQKEILYEFYWNGIVEQRDILFEKND